MEEALNVKEVAAYLRVSTMTVYRLIDDGQLRAFRTNRNRGGGIRVWPKDLEAFTQQAPNQQEVPA